MTAFWFIAALALVFAVIWYVLTRSPGPRAKIGPDGTNVREPESFVVHHEGKGQGIDIANTALKKRTEDLNKDLPGNTHKLTAKIPGRDITRMNTVPSDVSAYGDEKVAPGAEPKEKVLTEGPLGSRPESPEEPGSPYAKGRRVTDNHRDVELAAELLPSVNPEQGRMTGTLAASPSTTDQEPGYGLGRTAPGLTDGEGGPDMAVAEGQDASVPWDPTGLVRATPQADIRGEDIVVAMVRNPRSLYVYWEPNGQGIANLKAMLGDDWGQTVPVLRVFDVTTRSDSGQQNGQWFAVEITEHDDHWFLQEGIEPGRRYVVSYERCTPDGQYYMLGHSDPVSTPSDQPAEQGALYQRFGRQPSEWSGSPWK